MSDISRLAQVTGGKVAGVDVSANNLLVGGLKVGGVLLSGTSGDTLVGDAGGFSNFTPTGATVRGALEGIDSALTGSGSTQLDGTFKIENTSSPTKIMKFDASGITAGQTRTLKMADANVDLANLTNSNISASAGIVYSKLSLSNSIVNADINTSAAIAYSKLALTNSIVNADIASAAAIAYSKLSLTNSIVNSDIASGAAIAYSKLASLGGSTNAVLSQDSGGHVQATSILSSNLFLADGSVPATSAFSLGGFKITNLADPTATQDATTKNYVDNLVAGLTWKNAVRVASTANVSISSAPATIDSVTLVSGDRILLKDQTTGSQNGIYIFNGTGSALTRSTDMNTWNEVVGSVMLVTEGTVNTGSKWVNSNIAGGTLGTTAITFVTFSVNGTVNGTGTTNYVAYWSGTSTLTAEQFLAASRGGLGVDASGFTGILHFASGVATASLIVNADVSGSAAIAYSKLNLSGSIVNADINASAAIVYSKLSLSNSIVNADIASGAAIAYSKLALSNSIVNADIASGAAIAYSKLTLTNSIVAGDLTSQSVTSAKIATSAVDGVTITGGNGTALSVLQSPKVISSEVAGESMTTNTTFVVRIASNANSETSARYYKATDDTTSFDLFYVIGVVSSTSSITAGTTISIQKSGEYILGSSDSTFASGDIGKPVFLTTGGGFSTTAPSTAGTAVVQIGIVKNTDRMEIQPAFRYIN